jgi:hypothetical protein
MKRLSRSISVAAVTSVLALVGLSLPSVAAAVTPPPPGTPSTQTLTSSGTAPSTGVHPNTVHLGSSPAGCYGQTDNAHLSGTTSSVHGRTNCTFSVDQLGVTTTDWNLAWFGWNPLNSGSASRTFANKSGDATPHAGCSSTDEHSFYGSSTHYSIEGGTEYTGATASPVQNFRC